MSSSSRSSSAASDHTANWDMRALEAAWVSPRGRRGESGRGGREGERSDEEIEEAQKSSSRWCEKVGDIIVKEVGVVRTEIRLDDRATGRWGGERGRVDGFEWRNVLHDE